MPKKIDTSNIAEKRDIDKNSELLQHLKETSKDKKEGRKMGFGIVKYLVIISSIIMGLALIINFILALVGIAEFIMADTLKIYFGFLGAVGIGVIGYTKGTID